MEKFEFNIFKDIEALKQINIIAIIITFGSIIPFYALERLFSTSEPFYVDLSITGIMYGLLALLLAGMIVIIIHELIHGLFFKLFSPTGNVKYGYKAGMFYAASPGEVFNKRQFSVIILMPFIAITAILITALFLMDNTVITILLAFHTGACAGDFYYLYLLGKYESLNFVEDTEVGLTMYKKHPKDG